MTTPSYLNVPQVVDQNLDELFLIVWIGHNLAGLLEVYLGNDWVFSLILPVLRRLMSIDHESFQE